MDDREHLGNVRSGDPRTTGSQSRRTMRAYFDATCILAAGVSFIALATKFDTPIIWALAGVIAICCAVYVALFLPQATTWTIWFVW